MAALQEKTESNCCRASHIDEQYVVYYCCILSEETKTCSNNRSIEISFQCRRGLIDSVLIFYIRLFRIFLSFLKVFPFCG